MEMVYEPCYWMWGFGGGLLQWKNMMTAMERGKRWYLSQREINKNYNTKLKPLSVDHQKLYFATVMFYIFFYVLFSFFACDFPEKSKKNHKLYF